MARRRFARARRGFSRARSYGRRATAGIGFGLSTNFLLGAAIGLTNLDDRIPAEIKLIGATMPMTGGLVGRIKGVSQGMVFGNIIQHKFGLNLGGGTTNGGSNTEL